MIKFIVRIDFANLFHINVGYVNIFTLINVILAMILINDCFRKCILGRTMLIKLWLSSVCIFSLLTAPIIVMKICEWIFSDIIIMLGLPMLVLYQVRKK